MKTIGILGLAVCAILPLAGCNANNPGDRAAGGALLGGATGALIGAAATGRGSGALVGGAVGAATGAVIGASTTPQPGYYEPAPRRVYVEPAPVYTQRCWMERQPLTDRWGRVVGYRRVQVCG